MAPCGHLVLAKLPSLLAWMARILGFHFTHGSSTQAQTWIHPFSHPLAAASPPGSLFLCKGIAVGDGWGGSYSETSRGRKGRSSWTRMGMEWQESIAHASEELQEKDPNVVHRGKRDRCRDAGWLVKWCAIPQWNGRPPGVEDWTERASTWKGKAGGIKERRRGC